MCELEYYFTVKILDVCWPIERDIIKKALQNDEKIAEIYYLITYVITFVSDLRQVGDFLRVFRFPSPIQLTTTI